MNREDFPMLEQDIVYFDNGATTLKPACVVDKMVKYYTEHTSNIHRGDYDAAIKTNQLYDEVRSKVKSFINATLINEIIYTSGTTAAINQVVFGFMKKKLNAGDEVLISKAEHASNVLPWFQLQKEIGIKVNYIDLDDNFELTVSNLEKAITEKTKVVSIAYISNVVGDIRDVDTIGQICKDRDIYFVVDGAQAVSHIPVDVVGANIDFFAFSGHKMLGPTGVGILYGKLSLLEEMKPMMYGGGMNQSFEADGSFELKNVPLKFEAGTPPIAEVIGLGEAISYIEKIGVENIRKHEIELKKYFISELEKIDNIILYNKHSKSGIVIFNIEGVFSQDTSVYLNHHNIYIRSGNHCTKMLKDDMNIKNTCRASVYVYNNKKDIDRLIEVLKNSKDIFNVIL